jgi:selenium metabolism protein YedF
VRKVIVINSDTMGHGSEELGKTLVGSFLRKLWAHDARPDAIVFYNTGVKLLTSDSDALDALHELHKNGTDLVACGTCVNYFNLQNTIGVGRISNMPEIVSILMDAQVVTI